MVGQAYNYDIYFPVLKNTDILGCFHASVPI